MFPMSSRHKKWIHRIRIVHQLLTLSRWEFQWQTRRKVLKGMKYRSFLCRRLNRSSPIRNSVDYSQWSSLVHLAWFVLSWNWKSRFYYNDHFNCIWSCYSYSWECTSFESGMAAVPQKIWFAPTWAQLYRRTTYDRKVDCYRRHI